MPAGRKEVRFAGYLHYGRGDSASPEDDTKAGQGTEKGGLRSLTIPDSANHLVQQFVNDRL
jgi:hypothetical protein